MMSFLQGELAKNSLGNYSDTARRKVKTEDVRQAVEHTTLKRNFTTGSAHVDETCDCACIADDQSACGVEVKFLQAAGLNLVVVESRRESPNTFFASSVASSVACNERQTIDQRPKYLIYINDGYATCHTFFHHT